MSSARLSVEYLISRATVARRTIRIVHIVGALAVAAALSTTSAASAAATVFTWGNVGSDWGAAGDWSPAGPPTGGTAIAQFTSAAYGFQPMLLSTSQSLAGIWDNGTGALTIGANSPNVLTLSGTTVNGHLTTGLELDSGAGSLTISAPVNISAAQTWLNNSTTNPVTISGNLTNTVGGNTLTTSGAGAFIFSGSASQLAVTSGPTGHFFSNVTSTGTMSMTGGNLTTQNGTTFTISSGSFTAAAAASGAQNVGTIIGNAAGTSANMLVSGGQFVQTVNTLFLGQLTHGILTMNGGLVTLLSGSLGFEYNANAAADTGTANLNGGTLQCAMFNVYETGGAAGQQVVNFNGGLMQLTNSSTNLFGTTSSGTAFTANVGNGGMVIDLNGHATFVSNRLRGARAAADWTVLLPRLAAER